jgi:hypothetical protein
MAAGRVVSCRLIRLFFNQLTSGFSIPGNKVEHDISVWLLI